MNLMTEPVSKQSRHIPDTRTAKDWLDALATGTCDQRTFLRGLGGLLDRSPDSGWDMLALLDQYYRRGKISAETFASLKAHLQNLLMGREGVGATAQAVTPQIPTVRDALVKKAPTKLAPIAPASPSENRTVPAEPRAPSAITSARAPLEPTRPLAERTLAEGDVLRGRYRVEKLLGQGGIGSVFAAIDLYRIDPSHSEQRVAIKVLHASVIKRPRLFAELRREFQQAQSLSHPNIVRVHEFDRDGDTAFFTMEYLSGALLSQVLGAENARGMDRRFIFAIVRDVGAAIAHAHSRGLVHGDLNPGSIFITDSGDVRVLDFCAAYQLSHGPWISEMDEGERIAVATTTFASCELLDGEAAGPRDDVYSLACITYLLLTGIHPYQDITALKARSLRLSPKRPRGLSRRQWQALKAGLQFDRAQRPHDVEAWLNDLGVNGAAPHLPALPSLLTAHVEPSGVSRWVLAGVAAALLGVGAWWLSGHTDLVADESNVWFSQVKALFAHNDSEQNDRSNDPTTVSDAPARETSQVATAPVAASPAVAAPVAQVPAASVPHVVAQPSARLPTIAATVPRSNGAATSTAAVPDTSPGARARIELAADNVEVAPSDAMARVIVHRSRSMRGDVSFSWWTESGTAKPGQDFVAVKSHMEQIENGKNAVSLLIPIVMDPARHQERNFYIVIDEPSDNAALGPRTLTMVTIPAAE